MWFGSICILKTAKPSRKKQMILIRILENVTVSNAPILLITSPCFALSNLIRSKYKCTGPETLLVKSTRVGRMVTYSTTSKHLESTHCNYRAMDVSLAMFPRMLHS